MKRILCILFISLFGFTNVYGQLISQSEPQKTNQNMGYDLYDIGNKKICQFNMNDKLFFGFVNNPSKDYLDNLFLMTIVRL